jgi:hypothetical protein
MAAIAERVAAGAAFLDEHDPGWWRADVERAIELDRLRLNATDACVLGQRCPVTALAAHLHVEPEDLYATDQTEAYWAYVAKLSGLRETRELDDWAAARGFRLEVFSWEAYEQLTGEWKRVITGRRSAATATTGEGGAP